RICIFIKIRKIILLRMNLNAMLIFIVFISLFITYYLVQRQKILRQEKHDYLEEKKQQKLEELLKIAREEDKKSKEEQK
ncbi:MAG: hypothetical protein KAY28_02820, partial [Cloacibacterium sp.]|nr:hypothetical protein [Cloacibacterium sp.]